MTKTLTLARALALATFAAACTQPSPPPASAPVPAPATIAAAGTSPRLAGLEREVREIIRRHAGDTAEVSVAFRDLRTGDSLLVDGHRSLHAASTMKVPVMLELFRRADAGEIRLGDSVAVRNEFRSILDGSAY
ncbi:MAG TPA: serine hydrolase, partial [Longimicrobium sp.]|nr:serine hydrolase [Longimicrobium sp.]